MFRPPSVPLASPCYCFVFCANTERQLVITHQVSNIEIVSTTMFIFLPVSYPDPDPNPCYRSPGSQSTVGAKNGRRGGGHLRLGHERRAHLRVEVDRSVAHRVQQCKHRMLNYRKMPSSRQSPTECIYRMILRRQPEMFAKENRVLDPFRTAVPFWGQTT